ncbi:galactonate dehydratase [Streptomyces smyrnaeus]|uniref:Galactonate dehydratase n=1 Tax=Streptomyces smyrnaeus TaxID=1387713 RepID=A0ABS3Y209_9ACTN|nr:MULTISPECIES: galactonate dehydratase [Streptomyces]MBO8201679.1 galactonate dehydratase [Streptomyces smyrnaeus]MBQ0866320.1 galactonate dehydratase [Streptomyces sp. RK75]MBQ1124379.1 galactonate dehydratase [Streptomyces sp. B15]MBQ1161845.1 galactonate dehydratase [Streptomyces sp. A73]
MRITRVETFAVPPRWLFCRIETDSGLVGWGEPVVEGRARTVRTAVAELAEQFLLGADPLRIEDHWQLMTKGSFYRGGPVLSSAVAGLDQALWDIAGKAYGAPVHQLLGGPVREKARAYCWVGGDEPADVREQVAAQVAAGFTAVKMNASGRTDRLPTIAALDALAARAEAAREALGPDGDFAVDFHGRFSVAGAIRALTVLEPYGPMFAEEPVLPEYTHLLGRVTAATPVPIATGERLFSRTEVLPALQAGIAVVQPDLSHAGGLSEVRRIASLAETWDVAVAPHCPLGPLALAASLQLAFCTPNFLIQEQSIGIHYNTGAELLDYVVDREVFRFHDGQLLRPTGPGLGVTVDERAVREADSKAESWHNPVWRHPDGSFAEW